MPYIDTAFTEGTFLDDLKDLLVTNGWTYIKSFEKMAYPAKIMNTTTLISDSAAVDIAVAKHKIFKNAKGIYYGIAVMRQVNTTYGQVKGHISDEAAFQQWIRDNYSKDFSTAQIFVYMFEKEPEIVDGSSIGCMVGDKIPAIRGAGDIELLESKWVGEGVTAQFEYTKYDSDVMQSPWVQVVLRNPNLQKTDVASNWFPDSLITICGYVDSNNLFVMLQADPTPAFADNVVPLTPLYMGDFTSLDPNDTNNYALFGGTAFNTGDETASHNFDFDSTVPYRDATQSMPVLKTYPNFPGNGVDNIIVRRAKYGARYQAYYLSWNTQSNGTKPDRIGKDGGGYPKAWQGPENDEYKYQFNPSIYSGMVHSSKIYIVHPDEGVRGYLPRAVALAPFGLVNKDKLKVKKQNCPTPEYDQYIYFLSEAISPFSKRPATPYRPMGVGIFDKSTNS